MKKVYIITENTSEDYHGIYKEIIAVFSVRESAINKIKELEKVNYKSNIEYDYDTWDLEK